MKEMLFFFSCYNFTIDENAPNDAELGVDPEMLGRIFENLLEDNKDKGAKTTTYEKDFETIGTLYESYLKDLQMNSKTMKSGLKCFYARKSKSYIDKIDKFIGKKYGLTDEEIDFIINYDIKYRNTDD